MPTAVWPEIHIVPGMANPVPDIQTPKRGQDLNKIINRPKPHVFFIFLRICLHAVLHNIYVIL